MRIIIDAMGGDNAPGEVIKGAVSAARDFDTEIILVGDKEKIGNIDDSRISVVHAPEIIGFDEDPVHAVRTKTNSSIVTGLKLLADGKGDAFVSAGSTGAVVCGATLLVKRIKGVRRAAIGTVIPTKTGCTLLIDSGANADCGEDFLLQFAVMGNAYMKAIMGIKSPRIGLLSNGTEETKGSEVVKKAHELLKNSDINFIGNVEGTGVLNGACDVLAADGFSGNVFLKTLEGTAKYFSSEIKGMFMKNLITKLCGLIMKGGIKKLKDSFDAEKYGGAPVLGVNGVVIKAHGNAKASAIYNAVKQAITAVNEDIVGVIGNNI